MKKIIFTSTLILLALGGATVNASEKGNREIEKLLELQPGVTQVELQESITAVSLQTGLPEDEIIATSIKELEEQHTLDLKEKTQTRGASSGNFTLSKSTNKGDIFYTPSSTLGIQHGHSGIYFTKDSIIESIPSSGVRKIAYNSRNVEKNAVMQTVNTTQTKRNAAADWAKGRVGDKYSYNFATNRSTSHTGDKNCSKLLWSAYTLKASIDIDSNGGLGVYPKDIKDSSYVKTYKTIK